MDKEILSQHWEKIHQIIHHDGINRVISCVDQLSVNSQDRFQVFNMVQNRFYKICAEKNEWAPYTDFLLNVVNTYKSHAETSSDEKLTYLKYIKKSAKRPLSCDKHLANVEEGCFHPPQTFDK